MLPGGPELLFRAPNRVRDARPFPLPAMARRRGEVRRPEPEQIGAVHITHRGDVFAARHRFDDGHDEDVLVRLGRVFGRVPARVGQIHPVGLIDQIDEEIFERLGAWRHFVDLSAGSHEICC